ncbi:rhodanese-like domain-containing protein [Peterkaempfera sp. SMS 1(5)a]|uniref:rhodanese-like domain-containing protein n=1 Tax=Peterkaempfera podocarpi TaxID=3232308 RepID=UPI00366B3BC7
MFSTRTPALAEISPADAQQRAATGEAVLLDVREADEYRAGHAPGALWHTLGEVASGAGLPAEAGGHPLLVICRSGNRSGKAAEILARRGLGAWNVTGGMRAWADAGLPVHDAAGNGGRVL